MKYYLQAPDHQLEDGKGSGTESEDSIARDREMFRESASDYEPGDLDSESDDDMRGCRTPKKDIKEK